MMSDTLQINKPKNIILRILSFVGLMIFWFWKTAFVVMSIFILMPYMVPSMWYSLSYGDMPILYFILGIVLVLLPVVSLIATIGFFVDRKSTRNSSVLKLFYGFELPVLLLLSVYLFNLRDYNFGVYWLLGWAAFGFMSWLVFVLASHQREVEIPFPKSLLSMSGSTVLLIIGIFSSTVAFLFLIPLAVVFAEYLAELVAEFKFASIANYFSNDFEWVEFFSWHTIPVIAIFVFGITSMVLVSVFPFFAIYIYFGQFYKRLTTDFSGAKALTAVLVFAVIVSVHFYSGKQPQRQILEQLDVENISDAEKQTLLENSEEIRVGLVNAYLGQYRYMASSGTANILSEMYSDTLSLSDEKAGIPQSILNAFVKPLLYDGNARRDVEVAERIYAQFFDTPIQTAEQTEILRTLAFNWESSVGNAAGLLDVSEQKVFLESQTIDVDVDSQLATVTVTQKLVNQTSDLLEAVVHFSLPDHAVISGVWLSSSESEPEEYPYLVSPRGAAQAVYSAQVNRQIDPALLEKVGPRQYRLRIYPIPRSTNFGDAENDGKGVLYARIQYQSLPDPSGEWPVPKVTELRNLFWDANTVDTINGAVVTRDENTAWIPSALGVPEISTPSLVDMVLSDGRHVWAIPRERTEPRELADTQANFVASQPGSTGIVIDGSRSMGAHGAKVDQILSQFPNASVFFCQRTCNTLENGDVKDAVFFGGSTSTTHLRALMEREEYEGFDTLLLLTDGGSYELEEDQQASLNFTQPVWVLHLGDEQPKAYPDEFLLAIRQSGGGFGYDGVAELWGRVVASQSGRLSEWEEPKLPAGVQGRFQGASSAWAWFIEDELEPDADTVADNSLSGDESVYLKLASAVEIERLSRESRLTESGQDRSDQLALFTRLHDLASGAGIVTEYSSMIVLVNEAQREALELAEKQDDRFDRELELGAQATTVPIDSLTVPAVPEPREWAMLLVILGFLSFSYIRRNGLSLRFNVSSYR